MPTRPSSTVTLHEPHDVPSHPQLDCFLNSLFRQPPRETTKLRITGPLREKNLGRWWISSGGPVMHKAFTFNDVLISQYVLHVDLPGYWTSKLCFGEASWTNASDGFVELYEFTSHIFSICMVSLLFWSKDNNEQIMPNEACYPINATKLFEFSSDFR